MAKRKFTGGCTKDARIKIDYTGLKPNVRFSYPSKKHQSSGDMRFNIFIFLLIIGLIFLVTGILNDMEKVLGYLFICYILSWAIYILWKKQWDDFYPVFQGIIAKKKVATLKEDDLQYTDKLGWYCEVPVFENIILDYNAIKDFSKYMKYFEIREHKFKWYYKKRELPKRKRLRKNEINYRKEKKLNTYLWYARFYFTQKPEKGEIRVIFK